YRDDMIALMHASPSEGLTAGMRLVAMCSGLSVSALCLIVLIDAPWQLFSHFKKLRMSRQDVKQKHEESDGAPYSKGRIRQHQRSMGRRRMMSGVPTADVVVTSPVHYAVALKNHEGRSADPPGDAKGSNVRAAPIRAGVQDQGVP